MPLPVVLGLQELKLVFDPVAGLGHGELEARLPWLVWCLEKSSVDINNPNEVVVQPHLLHHTQISAHLYNITDYNNA